MIEPNRMKWEGHVALMRDNRNAYRFSVGKSEVKIPFGRARHRWEIYNKYVYWLIKYDGKS